MQLLVPHHAHLCHDIQDRLVHLHSMCCWILLRSLLECLHTVLCWLLRNYWFLLLYLSIWYLLCNLWICSLHGMRHGPILWPWSTPLQVICLTRRAVEAFDVIMSGPVQQLPSLLPASVLRTVTRICRNASPDSRL